MKSGQNKVKPAKPSIRLKDGQKVKAGNPNKLNESKTVLQVSKSEKNDPWIKFEE